MAKQCINCGAKIRFRENYFTLSNQGKYFCEKCAKTAEPLLNEIKAAASAKSYEATKEKFNEELSKAPLIQEAQKYLRYEFDDIARMASIVPDRQYANAKSFKGSFQACRDAVYQAGKTICGSEPVVPMQCIKISTSRDGDIYVVTAVFENYFMRTGSYASLSVTMIWMPGFFSKGTAVVSAVGSGGGDGPFNISWGAEEDFVDWFWTTLQEQNPEFEFKPYDEPILSAGITFENYDSGQEEKKPETTNRIGILGGTFDPVHMAHVALGRAAVTEAGLSKLIVMPAYIQPFKQGKRVTDDEHRLAMARLAFEDVDNTEISTLETDRMRVSYTYDTLTELKKSYPENEHFFITGADSFVFVDTWYKGIDLLQNFSFIVSVRPGCRETELNAKILEYKEKYGTNIIKLTSAMPDISSSMIREKYKEGESVTGLIPEKVERYIAEHGLYQRD